jgi:hypothetical protein
MSNSLNKSTITDEEFDKWFALQTAEDLVKFFGTHVRHITMRNGASYAITSAEDVRSVAEQELYEKMTGRE